MEIILDKRGCGLFFSLAALKAWAKKKGTKICIYYESKKELQEFNSQFGAVHTLYREDAIEGSGINIEEILLGSKREILTKDYGEKFSFDTREDCDWLFETRFESTNKNLRTDPIMIEIVKTLGVSASEQRFSHLVVVSIPDDVYYYLDGERIIYSKSPIYTTNSYQSNELLSEDYHEQK